MSDAIFQVRTQTDYKKCMCCQDPSKVNIRAPYKRKQDHNVYTQLEKDLKELTENGILLPFGMNLSCIDNGTGIAKTLLDSKAIYHAKCRLVINKLINSIREDNEAEKKRKNEDADEHASPAKTRKTCDTSFNRHLPTCCKCGPNSPLTKKNEILIQATSKEITESLVKYAIDSENWKVLGKLSTALDATAGDIHYHSSCKTELWTAARSKNRVKEAAAKSSSSSSPTTKYESYDPMTYAQLIAYIRYSRNPLRIHDLIKMYVERLKALGKSIEFDHVNTSRFKDQLLENLGYGFSITKDGKYNVISSDKVTAQVLGKAASLEESKCSDDITYSLANSVVDTCLKLRPFIFHVQEEWFKGSFKPGCMRLSCEKARPLLTAVEILLRGTSALEMKG